MSYKFNPFTGKLDVVNEAGTILDNYIVEHRTITLTEATQKKLTLANTPPIPQKVTLDIISGTSQIYNDDYVVTSNELSWAGLGLDVTLNQDDKLRIIYPI